MRESSSELIPILTARLVAEAGASITGGAAQVGRVALTAVIRSCTSWRASIRSVPRSKISSTLDSCGDDFDRRMSRSSTPLSACSSGTVTSSSTSAVDRPRQTVWTMTRGGANSGKTSSRDDGRTTIPTAIIEDAERGHEVPEAEAGRDRPAHERPPLVGHHSPPLMPASTPTSSAAADGHDLGAGRRDRQLSRTVCPRRPTRCVMGSPLEDPRLQLDEGPRAAVGVVDDRGVGHGQRRCRRPPPGTSRAAAARAPPR